MTTHKEALKLALEALESSRIFVTSREKIKHPEGTDWYDERITAIKEALMSVSDGTQPSVSVEQEPVAWCVTFNGDLTGNIYENKRIADMSMKNLNAKYGTEGQTRSVVPLYTTPPTQQSCSQRSEASKPLTDEQAYEIGAKGGEPSEAERLLFEAWMRGHCWAVIGDWDGKTYVHPQESTGFVNPSAMNTRQLWAAWRDRAALEAAHGIKE